TLDSDQCAPIQSGAGEGVEMIEWNKVALPLYAAKECSSTDTSCHCDSCDDDVRNQRVKQRRRARRLSKPEARRPLKTECGVILTVDYLDPHLIRSFCRVTMIGPGSDVIVRARVACGR